MLVYVQYVGTGACLGLDLESLNESTRLNVTTITLHLNYQLCAFSTTGP